MIRFTARQQAPVLMLEGHAELLMSQLGFPEEHWQAARGAWPEDRLPDVLGRLKQLLQLEAETEAERQAAHKADHPHADTPAEEAAHDQAAQETLRPDVLLAQRSWPIKRMIEAAIADNVPILWER